MTRKGKPPTPCRCYWCRIRATLEALQRPVVEQARVVIDPKTGLSTRERLPQRFTVER
jgi:hypothetical protein